MWDDTVWEQRMEMNDKDKESKDGEFKAEYVD